MHTPGFAPETLQMRHGWHTPAACRCLALTAASARHPTWTQVHAAPAVPTAHKGKQQTAAAVSEATRALQLGAFEELFRGEPEEQRLARAAASARCWDVLAANMQVRAAGRQGSLCRCL